MQRLSESDFRKPVVVLQMLSGPPYRCSTIENVCFPPCREISTISIRHIVVFSHVLRFYGPPERGRMCDLPRGSIRLWPSIAVV
jgi:hypothetical protein